MEFKLNKMKNTTTTGVKTLFIASAMMLSILTLDAQVQIGTDINGEAAGDWSGWAVSMPDANTIAIGAPHNDGGLVDNGHVSVYTWSGTAWIQKGVDIDGEAAADESGEWVSMPDANTLVIGANGNDGGGNAAGHVRVYTWSGTAWEQKGVDIDGEAAGDISGAVSMPDANTLAIGAPRNDGGGIDAGLVRVYSLATVDISENSLAAPLELYPNPASSILNVVVDIENLNSAYSIFDNTGRVVLTGKLQSEVTSIQLGDLPSGVYTISIGDEIRQTFQVNRE